jgi:hypothetical protein
MRVGFDSWVLNILVRLLVSHGEDFRELPLYSVVCVLQYNMWNIQSS